MCILLYQYFRHIIKHIKHKDGSFFFCLFFPFPTLEITGIEDLGNAMERAKEKSEHSLVRKEELNVGKGHQRNWF